MLLSLIVLFLFAAPDRDGELLRAIRYLSGVSELEQLDQSEVERYEALAARPIPLNRASRSRLVGSGLFSAYQLATLADYRARNGDILSFAELAVVDGFGEECARALKPFLTLEPVLAPGALPDSARAAHETAFYAAVARKSDASASGQGLKYGLKYRFSYGGRWALALAAKSGYDAALFPPEGGSAYALYQGNGTLGKVILGSFNARFGQGLVRWSGFSLETPSGTGSFSRRPSLLSPAWSYSGSGTLLGAAADFQLGRSLVSAYATLPLKGAWQAGANASFFGRYGEAGTTAVFERTASGERRIFVSADARCNLRGVDLFGEAALRLPEKTAALRAGARSKLGDALVAALLVRAVPSRYSGRSGGEYALSAGLDFSAGEYVPLAGKSGFGSSRRRHTGSLTAEASALPVPERDTGRKQLKIIASWTWQLDGRWSATLRISERLRNYDVLNRSDVRIDVRREEGPWTLGFRANAVASERWGMLGYAEGGYRTDGAWLWLRATLFWADAWNDRIYCYERDAPGQFNVPAYYGRGWSLSAVGALKTRRWGRWYLSGGWTGYARAEKKPGKAELKLQWVSTF